MDGDPARLAQVFSNLLTNAAKFTDPGGHIAVSASRDEREIAVVVTDSGVGIAPEFLPSLFETFVQERRTVERSQGGLGLGLSIVRSLVTMHGGTVSVHSEGRGRGATFTVRLPARGAGSAAGPAAPAAADAAAPALTGLRPLPGLMDLPDLPPLPGLMDLPPRPPPLSLCSYRG